jgi:hypothetical protein
MSAVGPYATNPPPCAERRRLEMNRTGREGAKSTRMTDTVEKCRQGEEDL